MWKETIGSEDLDALQIPTYLLGKREPVDPRSEFPTLINTVGPEQTTTGTNVTSTSVLGSVSATESPSKQLDRVFSLVSISWTGGDADLGSVNIWFKGYKGNSDWTLMTSGVTSPVSFLVESTGETVTVAVQAVSTSGEYTDLDSAPTTTVLLDGVTSAPAAPSISQSLIGTPFGYQFAFNQLAGLSGDVIDGYQVYRNTTNNSATATKFTYIPHNPTNSAPVVVQDNIQLGNSYFYWVSAINKSQLESSKTAAQSGSVVGGTGIPPGSQLIAGIAGDLGWSPVGGGGVASFVNWRDASGTGYTSTTASLWNTLNASIANTNIYARFTGYLIPSTSGTYTIGVNSDDGCNLFVGGVPLVQKLSTGQGANNLATPTYTDSGTITLQAGVYYPLILEYQQGTGPGIVQLIWTPPGGSAQVIPSGNLSTSPTSITSNLNAKFWNGTTSLWFPSGNGIIDFANTNHANKNLDQISDTGSYAKVATSRVNAGRPVVDFAEGIHSNKNLDNVADTGTYSRVSTGRVNSGRPVIDFSEAIHSNQNLDHIADGTRSAWDSSTQKTNAVDSNGNLNIKNKNNAVGTTSLPAITGPHSYSVIPEMTITVTTAGNKVLINFSCAFSSTTAGASIVQYALFRDGSQLSPDYSTTTQGGLNNPSVGAITWIDTSVSAGSHTYDIRWACASGSNAFAYNTSRALQLVELG